MAAVSPDEAGRERLRRLAERCDLPSLVVLAARRGRVAFSFETGMADPEHGVRAAIDTVFGLGSVSKAVLALSVMHLARAGRLRLHAPVDQMLGSHPFLGGVTAHHLLTHTSGLPPLDSRFWALDRAAPQEWTGGLGEWGPSQGRLPAGGGFVDLRGLLDYLDELQIVSLGPPGRWFSYSNEGYVMLGGMVAELCGASYQDAVRELILSPLGLERTAFIGSSEAAALEDVAVPHIRPGGGPPARGRWWDAPAWVAPGGMLASARDLLTLAEHLRTGAEGLAALMTTPHTATTPAADRHYGYGLSLHDDPALGVRVVGHGGSRIGTAAQMAWSPERGISAVALSNVAGAPVLEATRIAMASLLGADLDAAPKHFLVPPSPIPIPFVIRRCVLGSYWSAEEPGDAPALVVADDDGVLVATYRGRRARLRPVEAYRLVEDGPHDDAPMDLHFLVEGPAPAWGVCCGLRILTREGRVSRRHATPGRPEA